MEVWPPAAGKAGEVSLVKKNGEEQLSRCAHVTIMIAANKLHTKIYN